MFAVPRISYVGPTTHMHYARYLFTHPGFMVRQTTGEAMIAITVDQISYAPIEIPYRVTVDRIGIINGNPGPGNRRLAIYTSTGEQPDDLIVESASEASNGANQKQQNTIADTTLNPGYNFLAFNNDTNNVWIGGFGIAAFGSPANVNHGPSWFIENQAYGAFPAQATPTFTTMLALLWLRVKSIP